MTPTQVLLFETNPIRITMVDNEKRMSAVDVCKALGYKIPTNAWSDLSSRNSELKSEAVPRKLRASDGKEYETDTLNLEGVILLCMLSKTEKAVLFRSWAKKVLATIIMGGNPNYYYPELSALEQKERDSKSVLAIVKMQSEFFGLDEAGEKLWCQDLLQKHNLPYPKVIPCLEKTEKLYYKREIYDMLGVVGKGSKKKQEEIREFLEKYHNDPDYCKHTVFQRNGHTGDQFLYTPKMVELLKKNFLNNLF